MKTIYSFVVILLFAQFVSAQTNAPVIATNAVAKSTNVLGATTTNAPVAIVTNVPVVTSTNVSGATSPNALPALPAPRRTVPFRGTNLPSALTLSTNVTAAPSRLAPPTISIPSVALKSEVRTNALGQEEVADINYDFPAFPLEQALQNYAKLVGRTMLRSPQIPPQLQLTLKTETPLTKTEAVMAWETIFGMNGITIVPIGDKFMKVVVEAQASGAGGKFSELPADELPDAGRFVTHIVQLKYALAPEVQTAIAPFAKNPTAIVAVPTSNTLIIRDYSENVKRMLEVIEKIDIVSELNVKPEVIPIKYALASDIQQVLGSLTASGPGVSVGRSTRGASTTPGGYQPGAAGQPPIQGQPQPSVLPGTSGGRSGLSSAGTTGQSAFQRNLQNIVGRLASGAGDFQIIGQAKIIADDRTNSLLIFANDQDMVMIKTIIAQLDVVLSQVLIESIIMEVTLDDSKDLGVSYLQRPQQVGNFKGVGGINNGQAQPTVGTNGTTVLQNLGIENLASGFSYFGSFGNDLDVAVRAVAQDSRVNVLSRPRIQTSHAVPATLFIGDTVPYITGTSTYGNINGTTASTYQEKRVGITLDILPLINPDGLVVMDIQENIQQLGPVVQIDGNPVPTTTERSALAKVAVRDHETIILGGFISTSKTKSDSGVPYLKDIPGLGMLFRSTHDQLKKIELIILMRPTVLPTPEAAALVASTEKDKMSGVKQTEFEIREEERKRNEAIEKEMRKKLGIKERSY